MDVERNNSGSEALTADETRADSAVTLSAEDFYYEGDYLVFTAAYHLKRGYCCNCNCRHCPYR